MLNKKGEKYLFKKWLHRLNIFSFYKRLRKRFFKTIQQQLFELKEKPQKVALGCVLGISINFIPTFGFGFIVAFFLATLLRINSASALITSLVTGPLVPFMYALNFLIGSSIFASTTGTGSFIDFIVKQYSFILKISSFQEQLLNFLELFGFTFMVGAAINVALFGTATYFIVSIFLKKIIKKRISEKTGKIE